MSAHEPATAIVVHEDDGVAHVIRDVAPGERVAIRGHATVTEIVACNTVPALHKIALVTIAKGDVLHRGRYRIGRATEDIPPGAWVHVHNLEGVRTARR